MKIREQEELIDIGLLQRTQPQGGISFSDETFIRTGDGYECCLHVMEYPMELDDFWIAPLTHKDDTVAIIDISSENTSEVKQNLNSSMKEMNARYNSTSDYTEQTDAQTQFFLLKELLDDINAMKEVIKKIDTRIFVSDRTWNGLEDKVKNIKTELDEYKTFVQLNELKNDWTSMYKPYSQQQIENKFAIEGQAYTSYAVAGGYPFHYSCLEDPFGGYYGFTSTGGNFMFDLFRKTKHRRYYNALVYGTMGSGKSTLLKMIIKDRTIRGDFIRNFDPTGEFEILICELGGKILKPDGSGDDAINPLEILQAADSEELNYSRHIAKMSIWYKNLFPEATQDEVTDFTELLRFTYAEFDLLPEKNGYENHITGKRPEDYPILQNVVNFIDRKIEEITHGEYKEIEKQVAINELTIFTKIKNNLNKTISTYGKIFNRHSTINNILDEQLVNFDISDLRNMEARVFDAQMGLLNALCWDNAIANGKVMKEKYESGKIDLEDVIHTLTIMDESHAFINAKKLQHLESVILQEREGRKYFSGIILASQSVRDYIPEGSDINNIDKLKTVFELSQYKFIFQQDNSSIDLIKSTFNSSMPESFLTDIPTLELGECIFSISSDRTLKVNTFITDDEKDLFHGGA